MDQSDENRSKLQYAMRIIQETFDKQTTVSQEETSKWKTQCVLQKKQISQLEEDVKQSQNRIQQMEKLLKEANESRNVIFRKFNALKKKHDQLSKFKSSIEHMLHGGADSQLRGASDDALDAFDEHLVSSSTGALNMDSFRDELRHMDSNNQHTSSSYHRSAGSPSKKSYAHSPSSRRASSGVRATEHSSSFDDVDDTNAVEAKTLYSQVKQALNSHQFKQFAANIRQLNSGQQSVDETLENIHEIFGPDRENLYLELERLVKSSAQE